MTTPQQALSPQPPYPQAKNSNGAKAWAALANATQKINVGALAAIDIIHESDILTSVVGGKFRVSGSIAGVTAGAADNIIISIGVAINGGAYVDIVSAPIKAGVSPFRFAASLTAFTTAALTQGDTIKARIRAVNEAAAIDTVAAAQAVVNLQEFPA